MQTLTFTLSPEEAASEDAIRRHAARASGGTVARLDILRKSIDARRGTIAVNLSVAVYAPGETPSPDDTFAPRYDALPSTAPEALIVGSGPAGLFAALRLIELGVRPTVLERGADVAARADDIAAMESDGRLNPSSNYCFGEGGAGTFSDGKLYSRSKKRGSSDRIFHIFHHHGAADEILYEAHPHIGSDRLPEVIRRMRRTILSCGGRVLFHRHVTQFHLAADHTLTGVSTADGEHFPCRALILATGHSARDVYAALDASGIALEAKGFAMGVRAEHPQALIDELQYHRPRGAYLPAASYALVAQSDGRGVYSFCMCPGGQIVPSSTASSEMVVNGMSLAARASEFANSGIVVEIRPSDIPPEYTAHGALAGLYFQQEVERLSFVNGAGMVGGDSLVAPAQRLADFVSGRLSTGLQPTSYRPGVVASPLHFWLPEFLSARLRDGFRSFDRRMKGYLTNEAIVVGVESRSSSPVRIPRERDTLMHPDVGGLFPAGEGAGYAGGITSSAIDGERVAEQVAEFLRS